MNTLIATDLDRTMIFSRPAMGDDQFHRLPLRCVEIYDGKPLSYMTESAYGRFGELGALTQVVPVTTRTPEQYHRIDLPGLPYRYAITSSGGRILTDGTDDPHWRAHVLAQLDSAGASLAEVIAELRTRIADDWVSKLRVADDLFCYLVVDLHRQPVGFLPDWTSWCAERDWAVSQQGRKIYALPAAVTKSSALAEVRRRLIEEGALTAGSPTIAAGDGGLDADLLDYADNGIRPAHGELHDLGWNRPNVEVTAATGAEAGAEIVEWFHRTAGAAGPPSDPERQRTLLG